MLLKWQYFGHKAKFEKRHLLFRSKIGAFDLFFKRLFEESFEDLEINNY